MKNLIWDNQQQSSNIESLYKSVTYFFSKNEQIKWTHILGYQQKPKKDYFLSFSLVDNI